jgi:cation transport ATPase
MTERVRAPASSATPCPTCGKGVDSLRAGQVAILDGRFRYFCDASCKASYVEVASKRAALDAVTAEPPAVSASRSAAAPIVASGVRDSPAPDAPEEPSFPAAESVAVSGVRAPSDEPDPLATAKGDELADEEPEPDAERPPATLRSPATLEAEVAEPAAAEPALNAAPPASSSEARTGAVASQLLAAAPIAGVCIGVLASVLSLAGEPAGVVRLPLALAAAAVVLTRLALAPREPSDVSPWVVAAPIAAGSVLATLSTVVHDPRAETHASFLALAAASALAVELLLGRGRREIRAARARTVEALAVPARLVAGEDGTVEAGFVKPGEQVVVEAGETVAVDGIVAAGEAEVAPWLDSPVLASKSEGDAVVAGAVVVSGRIRVRTTFSGPERAWLRLLLAPASRIDVAAPLVALVRRSIERGAPVSALLVAGAVYADNGAWLDVLVAACAGGFALAASAAASAAALAHARAHVAALRRGIVYKDAAAFDAAGRADVAVFCSRGTILLGAPEIVAVETVTKDGVERGASEADRVLAIAAGTELSFTHPYAAAILREARARGVRPENVRSALGHSGLGVTALAPNGDRVIVGSRSFLLQEKVSVAVADARTSELEAEGRSVLLVAVGGRLVGLLGLQDGLRSGARAAVQRMHDAHIEPVLLSGEARETSETIARSLDIEHVRPEILPAERGTEVRALGDGGHLVAALGHASTDDGALGAADVSIAMEAAGAAPGEWGVALASDDVRDAALALTVPRDCRERSRKALLAGGLAQALGALGVAFGIAPAAAVPVLGVVGAALAVTVLSRD